MSERELNRVRQKFGMVYQYAALLDSITVLDNVAFPLVEHTKLVAGRAPREGAREARGPRPRRERASRKYPGGALGRHAQARGPGARAHARPAHPRLRRADERPRSADEPRGGRPHRGDAAALRRDEHRHHPRHRELLPRSPTRPSCSTRGASSRAGRPRSSRTATTTWRASSSASRAWTWTRSAERARAAECRARLRYPRDDAADARPPAVRPGWPAAGPQPSTDAKAVVGAGPRHPVACSGRSAGWGCRWACRRSSSARSRTATSAGRRGWPAAAGMATAGHRARVDRVAALRRAGWRSSCYAMVRATTSVTPTPSPCRAAPTLPPTATARAGRRRAAGDASTWSSCTRRRVSLRAQLADEVKAAKAAGETVLVQTTARSCAACAEVARAMREPELQTVLANVRLVQRRRRRVRERAGRRWG